MSVDIRVHIAERIKDCEEHLVRIAACRKKEMDKKPDRRNYELLYMLHKDEALYRYCLDEFGILLTLPG